jgi:Cu(I)/Ag(I) efflux system membrane fusion protein
MKIPIKLFPVWMMMLIPVISLEQEKQLIDTVKFRVSGVCDECKMRIENAALIKGVKWVQWDKETHILTAVYRTDKTNPDALQHAVAQAGHDTEKEKAPDRVYQNLPRCCAYRDGVEKH